jgi:lipopolysaccharide export system permease protein
MPSFFSILNRYVMGQLALMTLFITGVLIGAVWLAQSLRFVDILINGGMGIFTFIKMIHFLLPDFLVIILPLSGVIATISVYSKLSNDRELLVMRGAGLSNWALAWPAVLWSLVLTLFLYGINLYVLPIAFRQFRELEFNLKQNSAAFALQEGEFNSVHQMTAYVRARRRMGELQGIVLYDQRNREKPTLIIAEKGSLLHQGEAAYLKMNRGSHQVRDSQSGKVSVLYFNEFILNLTSAVPESNQRRDRKPHEKFMAELLRPTEEDFKQPYYVEKMQAEAHQRLVRPLYSLCFILLFLAIFLSGERQRHHRHRRTMAAVTVIILIQGMGLWFVHVMVRHPAMAPLFYLQVIGPALISMGILLFPFPWGRRKFLAGPLQKGRTPRA